MIRGKKRDGVREYAEYLSSNCCGMILIHRVTVEERFLRVPRHLVHIGPRSGFDSI
jgi:hypothetical protein